MASPYRFPVFFNCATLDEEQKKKVENYFQIRRKSGGGECGSVTETERKVYSIAFKDQEAQQRVLQKPQHVLKVGGGSLVLTVRDNSGSSSSPDKAPPTPESPKQGLEASPQKQLSNVLSTLSLSDEEYKKQVDLYVLRYLKECPKALEELEKKLASLSCSAQLRPDEEKVLVRCSAQPGAVGEVSKWKSEVDKIFDSYMSHYEMDSHKIKALLKSHQSTDEVKVYSDIGMAVVVGERSQVQAKLIDLESICVKSRASSLSETQTIVRILGGAKLRLLWKVIECSLRQSFPRVKVTQADEGKLMLTGSVEEIFKAGEMISDKEKLVFERTVSNQNPQFLSFLRWTYSSPGMLCDFLGVCDKVEVELQDTEIYFFSFSSDKLDDSERKMKEKFKDIKYNVPNCTVVPPELREKLKSKTNEMNQKECRAEVMFDVDSSLCLLGHTKEVDELSEIVTQFILDQSCIEERLVLPFPELCLLLPELLQLYNFDFSGVTFHPLTSSSRPTVVLEGSSGKVTEVRNRLGPFLDSLVQGKVSIDLPGAVRYFDNHSGREKLLHVSHFHKCLIQLEEQPHINRQTLGVAKYNLQHGLQVMVCQGDITKQYADAIVNAANEDLSHSGGVAAALSKAGGPQVQKESNTLIKQTGKIPVGDVVVTTGGNLKCKTLFHAVGPESGKASGREKILLEKTVHNALRLAETMEFKSIAMPCISSGIFGVPVKVCADAIVTAIREFTSQGGLSLSKIILIDNKLETVQAMKEACEKLLQRKSTQGDVEFQMNEEAAGGATAGDTVLIEIVQGTIETQQVDALVSPMASHDPLSTRVGNALSNVVGPHLTAKFHQESGGASQPGDAIMIESTASHSCKAVIFLNLARWDNNQQGNAVQALRQAIRKLLASCENKGFSSVALPVLGTGGLLRFPHSVAAKVILEEVGVFEKTRANRSPFLVRIVVHSRDKESSKAFQSAQGALHLIGFTNDVNPSQASFYRHVSATNDEVTATLGGVKLQLVFGDIVKAGTDVIVNTTDFCVSKAILTAAGPSVETDLPKSVPAELICTTGPGLLGCKEIIHASFKTDPQLIQKHCKKILAQCESKRFSSVAFPAINTGQAGMNFGLACSSMLDGMASAISDLKPNSLSLIRIVIFQQPVFQAFRSELESRFGQIVNISLKEKAQQKLKKLKEKCPSLSSSAASQSQPFMSSKPLPAEFQVISCSKDVKTIKKDLEDILNKELCERTVEVHDLIKLEVMEVDAVLAKIKVTGIGVERRKGQSSDKTKAGDVYVLRGFKEDVLSVTDLINRAVKKALEEDSIDKEEALVALNVQWAIKDENGEWQELSLHDNYKLEEAHIKKEVSVEMTTPQGRIVKVNLKADEATDWQTGRTYKLKRSESTTDFELPTHWEPMQGENFKKVELQQNSAEYQKVANGFLKTARYNIHKIERVQNFYLWQAFSVWKQRIIAKNSLAELGEMSLYHGTNAESCNCIEKGKFDRGYAGAHAAVYGKGVYFAVNANYSADRYSPADASGLKRLYAARVITGRYTVGSSSMVATPPRGSDPTDCFDSLVDNQQPPSMFIIFHDDQAYPEYLITFR